MQVVDQTWALPFHLGTELLCDTGFTYAPTNTFNSSFGTIDMDDNALELQLAILHSRERSFN